MRNFFPAIHCNSIGTIVKASLSSLKQAVLKERAPSPDLLNVLDLFTQL